MISFCKYLLRVSLLTFFIFVGRIHKDVIINNIMFWSTSASETVSISLVTVIALWIWKCQENRKKIKALAENETQLKKQLQETEETFADEVQKLAVLKNLGFSSITRILENQREQFKLQLEDIQNEMEEIKEKLQVLERKIAECEERKEIDKTEEYLREKQKQLNAVWKLDKRKGELEKLQLNTEKLLQRTEADGFIILTEMKMKLKNDMKQTKERLDEEKKERERLQQSWFLIF